MKDLIRSLVPKSILDWYRKKKKVEVRKSLSKQKEKGEVLTTDKLVEQFQAMGIKLDDSLMQAYFSLITKGRSV